MELFKASNQWATRPADETFESVEAMHTACAAYRSGAGEATVQVKDLRVEVVDRDIKLVGKTGVPATLTHWSFGQLCTRASAPAGYLRELPATLAAQNLNHGLAAASKTQVNEEGVEVPNTARLLFHKNGSLVMRAALTERYSRIWNCDVTERLASLVASQPQWHLPLAYARNEGGDFTGSMRPRGAYASDHDMFCFLVDTERKIEVPGAPAGLNRGFFVWNSEVGASSFGVQTFLFDYVCGNHIVWGARNVTEVRVRHVGAAQEKSFAKLAVELRQFSESSTGEYVSKILLARGRLLGTSKDDVLDTLLGRRIPELSRKRLSEAYDAAERSDRYGSPRSVWGMVNGITEISQRTTHTDTRTSLDRAAGKVLEMAF